MDAATLAAICMLHAQSPAEYPLPSASFDCTTAPTVASPQSIPTRISQIGRISSLRSIVSTPDARDAMARTVIAEAGNQGDSGMAGVVYTILNRLSDGRWGGSVQAVVDAPGQFEPVMRAGGSWRALRPVTAAQEARVNTIVNLALDGRLPDLTGGVRYFQNPQIVATRARGRAGGPPERRVTRPSPSEIFVGENRVAEVVRTPGPIAEPATGGRVIRGSSDAADGIFVAD